MSQKQNYLVILSIAFVSVFCVAIAYAALSATLNITMNKVTQTAISGGWNVAFDTTSATVQGTAGGTGDTGRSCGAATVTANSITVADTELSKPEDKCTYAFTIKNTGGIDAVLTSVIPTEPAGESCTKTNASANNTASMVCGNITYTVAASADASTDITTGGTLVKTTGSQPVYLIVEYTGQNVNTTGSDINQSGATFTFRYDQA